MFTYSWSRLDTQSRHDGKTIEFQEQERVDIITGSGEACWYITVLGDSKVYVDITCATRSHGWYIWKHKATLIFARCN